MWAATDLLVSSPESGIHKPRSCWRRWLRMGFDHMPVCDLQQQMS